MLPARPSGLGTPSARLTLTRPADPYTQFVESELRLLSPWQVPHSPEGLTAELKRELSPGHPLFDKRLRALAVARDRDDVLFEIADGEGRRYAVVHLTWTGHHETAPNCPWTDFFESLERWHEWMAEDHKDYTWGDASQP